LFPNEPNVAAWRGRTPRDTGSLFYEGVMIVKAS
jgi:hypothetical protein